MKVRITERGLILTPQDHLERVYILQNPLVVLKAVTRDNRGTKTPIYIEKEHEQE